MGSSFEKTCRKCGLPKDVEEHFHKNARMADGYLNVCKTCQNEVVRKNRENRMLDPGAREAERDRLAAWRAANPEAWKAAQERAQAVYRGTPKDQARRERRRVATKITPGPGAHVSLKGVLEDHGMVCSICTHPIEHKKQLTFDHVIPLARGGQHTTENLRPAHRRCNSWKGDRLPEEIAGFTPPEPGEVDDWELRRQEKANQLRGEATRARMAAMTPEERAARAAKISAANTGKSKRQFGPRASRAPDSPETIAKRQAGVAQAWANKTPEEREAWKAKCRAIKAGSKGNIENLKKGWQPEVRAKAIQASADLRRGVPETDEHKAAISEGVRRAYTEGRRS